MKITTANGGDDCIAQLSSLLRREERVKTYIISGLNEIIAERKNFACQSIGTKSITLSCTGIPRIMDIGEFRRDALPELRFFFHDKDLSYLISYINAENCDDTLLAYHSSF